MIVIVNNPQYFAEVLHERMRGRGGRGGEEMEI